MPSVIQTVRDELDLVVQSDPDETRQVLAEAWESGELLTSFDLVYGGDPVDVNPRNVVAVLDHETYKEL